MEPPKESGNSCPGNKIFDCSAQVERIDTLLSKLTSRIIEDQRSAAEGSSQRGKLDAVTALFNLCIFQGNVVRSVRDGVVPILMKLVTEPGGEMVDHALAIMAILANHPDGKAAIGALDNIVKVLVEIIGNGSPRNRENAAAVLVHLCSGDHLHLTQAWVLGVMDPVLNLAENGTDGGKQKAAQLLKLMGSFAEQP